MDAQDEIELLPALDFLGREIRVGDTCVYPVRRGSSMWINKLTIQKINHDPKGVAKLSGVKGDGYPVTIKALDRVVIIGRDGIIPYFEQEG